MKITSKLGIKYLIKNKRKTVFTLLRNMSCDNFSFNNIYNSCKLSRVCNQYYEA